MKDSQLLLLIFLDVSSSTIIFHSKIYCIFVYFREGLWTFIGPFVNIVAFSLF